MTRSPSFSLLLIAVWLLTHARHANCILNCKEPTSSGEVFIDLPMLQLISVQHPDALRTPISCSQDNRTSTCAKQICCEGEVGCCFNDPESGRQACGCRALGDTECSLSAPLALLRSYVCTPHKLGQISVCLRKLRDGEIIEASISTSNGKKPERDDTIDTAIPMSNGIMGLVINGVIKDGDVVDTQPYKQLTAAQLQENVPLVVLDDLVDQIIAKRAEGIPYGQ